MAQGKTIVQPLIYLFIMTYLWRIAMQFTADFKLGHYMKVPPRPMFWAQVRPISLADYL
jgi:hypothetical protein